MAYPSHDCLLTMKGKATCYNFLKAGKPASDHQMELPSTQVDREAMASVMVELYRELSALKSRSQTRNTSDASLQGNTGESSNSAGATASPLPSASSQESESQSATPSEKKETDKLCKSMWGKVPCPGEGCERIHLEWCSKPNCFIREEKSKECKLWHGHMRVAFQREKARRKKEAEIRKNEAEQRESSKTGRNK